MATPLKSSFKAARTYQPIHTGGHVLVSADASWLFTTLNQQALVTELATGTRVKLLKGDTSPVTTSTVTPTPASPHAGGYLLTCTQSLSLQIYSLPTLKLHKSIPKAHEAPIITCCADPTGMLFATGASDGIIKVWDASKGYCTHVFKGHGGVISALVFDIDQSTKGEGNGRAKLISGADDCKIRVWDLRTRECLFVLDGHVSVVRGLDVTDTGKVLVSGGRDRVVNVWDLERGVLRKTIPVFETIESVGLIKGTDEAESAVGKGKAKASERLPLLFTGGDKGVVRIWDLSTGQVVQEAPSLEGGKVHEITQVLYTPGVGTLTSIHVDQNIIVRSVATLAVERQIIGFNDEVIDLAFLSLPAASSSSDAPSTSTQDSHLAVATNSDLIRVYDLAAFNTSLLEGHKDVVLCLDTSSDGRILFSGSKDKTARIWRGTRNAVEECGRSVGVDWDCVAICEGHVESVGAIAISKQNDPVEGAGAKDAGGFLVTASQDRTVKIWDIASILSPDSPPPNATPTPMRSLVTLKIHEKDINSLSISPNNALLASGSQDRTAKLFAINYVPARKGEPTTGGLKLLGSFVGHKRGIWCVKFSPVDRCLATASGDRTVKLWNLGDFSCIKTFEGHSNSVLRVDFLTRGMQLVSTASDGLVKVWNVKDEECATTLDGHEEKIWALAVAKDEKVVVSGGADSVITFWEDVTVLEQLERVAEHADTVRKEQDFENYLTLADYSSAILLALSMNQPRRLLKLFILVQTNPELPLDSSLTGSISVDKVLQGLGGPEIRQLIAYVRDWNTSARTAEVAQLVLFALFKFHEAAKILEALEGKQVRIGDVEAEDEEMEEPEEEEEEEEVPGKKRKNKTSKKYKPAKASEILGALIPYTERHFARADKLVRESFIVEHLLGMMDTFDEIAVV